MGDVIETAKSNELDVAAADYAPELAEFVLAQVGSHDAVSRIVADALKQAKRERGGQGVPRGYLFRIAHDLTVQHLRKVGRYSHDFQEVAEFALGLAAPDPDAPSGTAKMRPAREEVPSPAATGGRGERKDEGGEAGPLDGRDRNSVLEGAVRALPTRRMELLFERRIFGRGIESLAEKFSVTPAEAARELATALVSLYLQCYPEYPDSAEEQDRLLSAFGWRIRLKRGKSSDDAPQGLKAWLKVDETHPALYREICVFWESSGLLQACEVVQSSVRRRMKQTEEESKPGGGRFVRWMVTGVILACLGAVGAALLPELFEQLLSFLWIPA